MTGIVIIGFSRPILWHSSKAKKKNTITNPRNKQWAELVEHASKLTNLSPLIRSHKSRKGGGGTVNKQITKVDNLEGYN